MYLGYKIRIYTNQQPHLFTRFLGDGQKDYSGSRNTVDEFKSFFSHTKQIGLISPYLIASMDKLLRSTYQ